MHGHMNVKLVWQGITTTRCVTTQKIAVIYFAAEA
jgi:hypothetical protein